MSLRNDIQFIQHPDISGEKYKWGDTVRLTTANLHHEYQLDVSILRRDGKQIHGYVSAAAPTMDVPPKEWEVHPGEVVVFEQENIAKAVPGSR